MKMMMPTPPTTTLGVKMLPNNDGLYYTHANKTRRKFTFAIIFVCFACLSTPVECQTDEKVVRVDPLGILKFIIIF